MQRIRPTSVTVIAILQLVFGGIWLLCGLVTLGMQASGMQQTFMNMGSMNPGNNPQLAKQKELQDDVKKFSLELNSQPMQYFQNGQTLTLSLLMIFSGIGLLNMRKWGRTLAFVYATLSILSHIAMIVYMVMVTIPATQQFASEMAVKGQDAKMLAGLMQFGVYVGLAISFLSMIYPTIVLILLLRPGVAAAFRGERVAPADVFPASDQIEEDDRWGHA